MTSKMITEKEKEIIKEMYENGYGGYEIAKKFGYSATSIYNVLKELNVASRNQKGKSMPKEVEEKIVKYSALYREYIIKYEKLIPFYVFLRVAGIEVSPPTLRKNQFVRDVLLFLKLHDYVSKVKGSRTKTKIIKAEKVDEATYIAKTEEGAFEFKKGKKFYLTKAPEGFTTKIFDIRFDVENKTAKDWSIIHDVYKQYTKNLVKYIIKTENSKYVIYKEEKGLLDMLKKILGVEKMSLKVLNGLPLGAMPKTSTLVATEIDEEAAKILVKHSEIDSYVGHEATAKILSVKLEKDIAFNRASAEFKKNESFLVCSLAGPRLAEGQVLTEEEMKGIPIRYFYVEVK